ncbi:MAG: hypothetical protein V4638_12080 [Bacteroidota bacterium]
MSKLFLALILVLTFSAQSQTTGFYGKKNFIDFSGLTNFKLFSLLFEDNSYYKPSFKGSNNLAKGYDLFDFGFRASYNRVIKNNFAIGLEGGMDFQHIGLGIVSYGNSSTNAYYEITHERLKINSFVIMPKITLNSKGSLLPIGISHEIGVGYTNTKIVKDDYVFKLVDYGWGSTAPNADDTTNVRNNYVDYDKRYSGFTLMYGLKFRTPLTKTLLLNYGFRYTLNLRNYGQDNIGSGGAIISYDELARQIGRTRVFNFVTFSIGLSLAI